MRKTLALLFSLVVVLGSNAQDVTKLTEEDYKKAGGLQGVSKKEFGKSGELISILATGKARISTVFGKTAGVQKARKDAEDEATKEFLKFLKKECSLFETSKKETMILLEGNEGSGGESLNEKGKMLEKSTSVFETRANGLVRGLATVWFDQDPENKEFTIVMRWTLANARGAEKASSLLNNGTVEKNNDKPAKDNSKAIPKKSGSVDD